MRLSNVALACVATLALGATGAHAEKWDMPMAYAASNYHSQNGENFAKCVTDATGGKLEVVTHPGGSLFKGGQIKRAVQTGQAPIGERLLSAHANENPLFGVDSVPFVATSFDDSEKLWKAAADKLKAALDAQNLVYIYAVPWPPQGLYFKKPVEKVADMKGIKFRAYNAATSRIAELAGMVPVQIEAAELSQALATGVASAFISSGSTGYDRKVWEHLTHFYDVQAWLPRNTVFANKSAFNGLDGATKKAVTDCGAKAAADGLAKAKELTSFYLDGLRKGGMTVAEPGAGLKKELQGFGEIMTKEWLKAVGSNGKDIIDAFRGN
ncbi:MAG: TRAP transporter substrate-binding protein [Hyphomicrobiaceae bacterium]